MSAEKSRSPAYFELDLLKLCVTICQGSAARTVSVVVQELLRAVLVVQLLHNQSCCVELHGAAVAFPVLQHGLLAALVCSSSLEITQLLLFVHGMKWKWWNR